MHGGHPENIGDMLVFTIYTSDLQYWVKKANIYNYADDTSSSCSDKELAKVLSVLELDARTILSYMASNGLVANPNKTVFMLINNKSKPDTEKVKIQVGENLIEQENSTTLLGMKIQDNLGWKNHFLGTNGLIPSLNKRLYAISRIKKYIPAEKLPRLAHASWTSKLRYGLQLYYYF